LAVAEIDGCARIPCWHRSTAVRPVGSGFSAAAVVVALPVWLLVLLLPQPATSAPPARPITSHVHSFGIIYPSIVE
jgi:hypothetical protein